MSGWLSRAKGAFGGREAESVPEPIEIACPCGRRIEATRRPGFQRVLCKECGEPFFLLPLDVYPRPVMKIRKVKPPKPAVRTKSPSSTPDAKPTGKPRAKTESLPSRPSIDLQKTLTVWTGKVRAQFTPLRLIMLCLLTVVGLTGWWQWNRAAQSGAETDFRAATEAGEAALQKKEFVEAARQFDRAADAANILRRQDASAEQVRQRSRQLTAINSLLSPSLVELLETAKVGRQKGNVAAVESEFASLHAGRWVVLQSEVTPASEPLDPATEIAWEQRVAIEGEALVLTGSLPIFSKIPATPPALAASEGEGDAALDAQPQVLPTFNDLGQREVLFSAQLESLKWDAAQSAWRLTLMSSTAFFWTDYDLLEPIGVRPDELRTEPQLRAMLLEQSRWIGAAE